MPIHNFDPNDPEEMNAPFFPSNYHVYQQQIHRKYQDFTEYSTCLTFPLKEDVVSRLEELTVELEVLQQKNATFHATMEVMSNEIASMTTLLQNELNDLSEILGKEKAVIQWLAHLTHDQWQASYTRQKSIEFQIYHCQQLMRAHFSNVLVY
jgi:hypothetical protein